MKHPNLTKSLAIQFASNHSQIEFYPVHARFLALQLWELWPSNENFFLWLKKWNHEISQVCKKSRLLLTQKRSRLSDFHQFFKPYMRTIEQSVTQRNSRINTEVLFSDDSEILHARSHAVFELFSGANTYYTYISTYL